MEVIEQRSVFEVVDVSVDDLASLIDMAGDFFREGKLTGEFNPEVFLRSWSVLLKSGMCHIIAVKKDEEFCGAIAYAVTADLNTAKINSQELFWFVAKEHRSSRAAIMLLNSYEKAAKEKGASSATMAHISGFNENLADFYQRRGYRKSEVLYRKDL